MVRFAIFSSVIFFLTIAGCDCKNKKQVMVVTNGVSIPISVPVNPVNEYTTYKVKVDQSGNVISSEEMKEPERSIEAKKEIRVENGKTTTLNLTDTKELNIVINGNNDLTALNITTNSIAPSAVSVKVNLPR